MCKSWDTPKSIPVMDYSRMFSTQGLALNTVELRKNLVITQNARGSENLGSCEFEPRAIASVSGIKNKFS